MCDRRLITTATIRRCIKKIKINGLLFNKRWENKARLHREIIENKKVTITTTQLDCKNSNQYSIIIIIITEKQ